MKSPRTRPERNASGVTLIEIILALTITALVLAIVYGALRFSYKVLEKGEARMDRSQHLRTLVERVVPVIRSAYPLMRDIDDEKKLFFIGESDVVGLVTSDVDPYRSDIANKAGLKWVRFFVDSDGLQMEETYFFNPDVLEDDKVGEAIIIDPNVTDMALEYLEIKEDETEGSWIDTWEPDEDKPELPRAVRVTLRVMDQGEEMAVPPFTIRIPAFAPVN